MKVKTSLSALVKLHDELIRFQARNSLGPTSVGKAAREKHLQIYKKNIRVQGMLSEAHNIQINNSCTIFR